MPFTEFWTWLESRPLAEHIGFTWWFPFLESIHVLAVGLVVGSILMVDLRLLGLTALRLPASLMTRELIPWTWGAFILAVITGTGLFMTRASVYIENPAFQIKLASLVLAGANMGWFQLKTFKDVDQWDTFVVTPPAAKLAGAASLLLWVIVVFAGRWVGHII
ncbi:MAG: hypothetical protein CL484_11210 [Acidobacteria bacterium]|nr:hypothetical protein [Acidobacteriota bacterium]|tara:strand:+ start:4713 stop:5201 length:489 start_codon:yes stop_codon:yes gene_type:complete